MNLPNLTGETIKRVGSQIVADLRESLHDGWGELSDADRGLVQAVADDVAKLSIEAIASAWDEQAAAVYAREARQVAAQLANIGAARQLHLADALLTSARAVALRAAGFVGAALIAAA